MLQKLKELVTTVIVLSLIFTGGYFITKPSPLVLHINPVIGGLTPFDINSEQDKLNKLADEIRSASPNQEILLYINSYGGSVFAGMTIINALHDTKAHTVAILDGAVMSEATNIALACKEIRVSKDSLVLIHLASGGEPGNEILTWINDDLMKDTWRGILTPQEEALVRAGIPWIVTGDVFKDRFDQKHKLGRYDTSVYDILRRLVIGD